MQDVRVGLYSFPKSGNTWLRAIMAGIMGIPTGPHELQKYLTDIYQGEPYTASWPFQGRNWYFYKSHHRHVLDSHDGRPLNTDKVLYIHRQPLDAFVSYLNFASARVSPDSGARLPVRIESVEALTPDEMEKLFRVFLEHGTVAPQNTAFGSIFEHARHFIGLAQKGEPVLILRYEDLMTDFAREIGRIAGFLDLQGIDAGSVHDDADGRTQQDGRFFWKRQVGSHRDFLTPEQIARFEERHAADLRLMGYAPGSGRPGAEGAHARPAAAAVDS